MNVIISIIKLIYNAQIRSEVKEGDEILYTNMPKLKKMPHTKQESKYVGPCTVVRVTDSHAIISNHKVGSGKEKKIPIDIVRPYYRREDIGSTRKRQCGDFINLQTNPSKKPRMEVRNMSKTIKHDLMKFIDSYFSLQSEQHHLFGFSKQTILSILDDFKVCSNTYVTTYILLESCNHHFMMKLHLCERI